MLNIRTGRVLLRRRDGVQLQPVVGRELLHVETGLPGRPLHRVSGARTQGAEVGFVHGHLLADEPAHVPAAPVGRHLAAHHIVVVDDPFGDLAHVLGVLVVVVAQHQELAGNAMRAVRRSGRARARSQADARRRRLLDLGLTGPRPSSSARDLQGQVGLVDGACRWARMHLHLGQLPAIHVFGQRHDRHLFVGDIVGDVHLDVRAVLLSVGIEAKPNSVRPQASLVVQEANRGCPPGDVAESQSGIGCGVRRRTAGPKGTDNRPIRSMLSAMFLQRLRAPSTRRGCQGLSSI